MDICQLKNKLKNTLHYKIQTDNLFKDYINSLFPKDYKNNNLKISNFSYQPLNKNIYFMAELLPITEKYSICYININITLEFNEISYSFDESQSKYNENHIFNKKYLFDALYNLINSISIDKLNSIFEKHKIIKKEYMKLEKDIKKIEEEEYHKKYIKYKSVIHDIFKPLEENEVNNLIEKYIKEDSLKTNNFNKIVYFKFDKDTIELCEDYISFSFDKNNKIKYKINHEVVSKKKFILAFSNQFYIKGKLLTSLEEALKNNFLKAFKDDNSYNKYRLKKINIKDFSKPFFSYIIANNF